MNWLLYLGGGYVWMFLGVFILANTLKKTSTIDLGAIAGWLMVWIWLCWKIG